MTVTGQSQGRLTEWENAQRHFQDMLKKGAIAPNVFFRQELFKPLSGREDRVAIEDVVTKVVEKNDIFELYRVETVGVAVIGKIESHRQRTPRDPIPLDGKCNPNLP